LQAVAVDIAKTDADEQEALGLVKIAIHESGAKVKAIGDGGRAFGPFQIRGGRDYSATEALRRYRWSVEACGDLSLYAGCGRCGACPDIITSLEDPALPRR
jgi:hypothetical protein